MLELLEDDPKIAIVGASNKKEKYGFKIYKDLKTKGYDVFPVNHKREFIQGDKAYRDIRTIPEKIDILNFVVPAEIGLNITKNAIKLGYKNFWYQPGASNNELIDFLEEQKDIDYITDKCIMVETD